MIYDRRAAQPVHEESSEDVGELEVAEWIILLLAYDTYYRTIKEKTGIRDPSDPVIAKGLALLRTANSQNGDAFHAFLTEHMPTPSLKTMLAKAFRLGTSRAGLPRQALQVRMVLSRGGASVVRKVFKTNRAIQEVKTAISASQYDDGAAALDKFAVLSIRNGRIRGWIDLAAKSAGAGSFQNAVDAASLSSQEDTKEVALERAKKVDGPLISEEAHNAAQDHSDRLVAIQQTAQEVAKKALDVSGESDEPPTKSEVIGIATAAAVAAVAAQDTSIPESLRKLDPEQRDAAMTNGKVLVAAGAGAGKSTTLVARVKHLVEDQGTAPSRILACSFNTAAAEELKQKLAKSLGPDVGSRVIVGTMNSLFNSFIVGNSKTGFAGFGTPEEKSMLTGNRLISDARKGGQPQQRGADADDEIRGKKPTPLNVAIAIRGIWNGCDALTIATHMSVPEKIFEDGVPKAKQMNVYLSKWQGNDVTLEQARTTATRPDEIKAAFWYELYLGLKGDLGRGWRPPCGSDSKPFQKFMGDFRRGGERLGDMNDQIKVLRDILKRDPSARKSLQDKFDHLLVDECQDLNSVQHEVFDMMSEHIDCHDKNRSIWMVGDDKQAIYQFRGAKPEKFTALHKDPCWQTKMIRTNYRCEPEIVETANKLIANNPDQIPMEARGNPTKPRGEASIVCDVPDSNATAAITTVGRIRKDLDTSDARPEQYAVLARTNAELNDFETACIINEIPYTRRGGKGFLDAPESKAVLSYIDLASGTDYEKKSESLAHALLHPDHGVFMGPVDADKAVKSALDDVARRERVPISGVDPTELLKNRQYARLLADNLKRKYKIAIVNSMRGDIRKGEWLYNKVVDELSDEIMEMGRQVQSVGDILGNPEAKTADLLGFILDNVKGSKKFWDKDKRQQVTESMTLREHISDRMALFSDDEEEEEAHDEEEEKPEVGEGGVLELPQKKEVETAQEGKGLGAVQFLYALMEPNKNDQDAATDPSLAAGFQKKLSRYAEIAKKLRIDPKKWAMEQRSITDPKLRQEKPPALTLSTIHSVKGMEWSNVTVMFPKGKFPMERKPKPGEPPRDPEEMDKEMKAERNLAYVAVTRAAKNLEIHAIPDPKRKPGMPLELSVFVNEMALRPGENVHKEGPQLGSSEEDVESPPEKTASFFEDGEEEAFFASFSPEECAASAYDRRTT